MAYQAGFNKGVVFQPFGAAVVTLEVTAWSWSEMVEALDVSHSGTGGIQAMIAGLGRGDGNVKANIDAANLPSFFGVRAGVKGAMRKYLGTLSFFTIPVLVVKVNYQSAVEGKVEYNFDVKLDYLVGVAFGTPYTYPSQSPT